MAGQYIGKVDAGKIGHYGNLRLDYLRNNSKEYYRALKNGEMAETLEEYLIRFNEECLRAKDMDLKRKIEKAKKAGDLPERDKEPLKWTGTMEALSNESEGWIRREYVYN